MLIIGQLKALSFLLILIETLSLSDQSSKQTKQTFILIFSYKTKNLYQMTTAVFVYMSRDLRPATCDLRLIAGRRLLFVLLSRNMRPAIGRKSQVAGCCSF